MFIKLIFTFKLHWNLLYLCTERVGMRRSFLYLRIFLVHIKIVWQLSLLKVFWDFITYFYNVWHYYLIQIAHWKRYSWISVITYIFSLPYQTGIGNSPIEPFILLHRNKHINSIQHIQITNSNKRKRKNLSFVIQSKWPPKNPLVLFEVMVIGYSVKSGTKWFQNIILSAS